MPILAEKTPVSSSLNRKREAADRPRVVFLGKKPPPYIGPAVATELILNSRLADHFDLIHLETSDHRGIQTLGALDIQNFRLALQHYLKLGWFIFKYRPDLVYLPIGQTTIAYFRDAVFILIARLSGRKVIAHLRGGNFLNWYQGSGLLTRAAVRTIHPLLNGQIVLGEVLRELFDWLLPARKIFVVPNGANYPRTGRKERQGRCFRVLFLSNLRASKGVFDLLEAVPQVVRKCPDVDFVFAGTWRNEETRVRFDAFLTEHPKLPISYVGTTTGQCKYDLLTSASAFVLPTYYVNEGHPWVIVEAMSFGLPVISTGHAAIPESVVDGENGFLVPKHDPNSIAKALTRLVQDPHLHDRMSRASRKRYLEMFTEEKMVERMTHAFREVLSTV